MQQDLSNVTLLAGNSDYESMRLLIAFKPFAPIVCDFLDELSKILIRHPLARQYPDVTTLGFFCRRSNITKLQGSDIRNSQHRQGRGVTFHIAPSNVPVNFAYSMVSALLAGNSCIVRVSGKDFPQVTMICEALDTLLKNVKFVTLSQYISIIRYMHDERLTQYFSSLCDVRIIWGGDSTIEQIRKATLPARAFDITFANRYSLAVFHAEDYLKIDNKAQIALDFFNDTYLFDQNACSSPRLIYWLGQGETLQRAREIFWEQEHLLLCDRQYAIQAITAVDKCMAEYRAAIDYDRVQVIAGTDNLISRVELAELPDRLPNHTCAGGSFFEFCAVDISALAPIVTREYQTITYIHSRPSELAEQLINRGVVGIDRIVPCGKASDFGLIWDGYDLIGQMTRVIIVR